MASDSHLNASTSSLPPYPGSKPFTPFRDLPDPAPLESQAASLRRSAKLDSLLGKKSKAKETSAEADRLKALALQAKSDRIAWIEEEKAEKKRRGFKDPMMPGDVVPSGAMGCGAVASAGTIGYSTGNG